MKFTKLALTLVCSAILLCGCAKNSDVVLKVNDTNITRGQYYEDFNRIKASQLKGAPKEALKDDSYVVLALKDRYTEEVVARALLSQEFDRRKLEATDEEVEKRINELISINGSEENFNNALKQFNITKERLREDVMFEVKILKLQKQLGVGSVSDAEVAKFYKANKAQFVSDEKVHAYGILINADKEAIKRKIVDGDKDGKLSKAEIESQVNAEYTKKESTAKDVFAKAKKNPKDFEKLAKQYSEDTTYAQLGGDMGYKTKQYLAPEIAEQLFKQKVGEVALINTNRGIEILLVKDKVAKGEQSLASVKPEIKAFLQQEKAAQSLQKFVMGLKDKSTIEYFDESLKPENLKKQLQEAITKQIQASQNQNVPKSKLKTLDKMEKAK